MLSNWWLVAHVWLILLGVQLVVGTWLVDKTERMLVDGGWAWGRLGGWLAVSLLIWWGANGGLVINTQAGVWAVTGGLLGGGGVRLWQRRKQLREKLKRLRWWIVIEEGLFAGGLVWMSLVRGFNPKILDLEKFMDGGFVNAYLKSGKLPAEDMWLAGRAINYYSFGHFMGSVMLRIWGLRLEYGYNLLLGLVFGLVLMGAFSVVINLLGKRKGGKRVVVGGIVGAILVAWGGNSQTAWYGLARRGFEGYWYADATRFISNTIHEFPAYSFVVSDLHAHVWDLPVVLLWLIMVIGWTKKPARWWEVGMGVTMGVMLMSNSWDVLVYGLLLLVYGGGLGLLGKLRWREIIRGGAVVMISLMLVSWQWWSKFEGIGQGLRWVKERSPWRQLMILWAGHGLLTVMALIKGMRAEVERKGWRVRVRLTVKHKLVWAMGITAICLLLIPEIVYVKDIYPSHPRANTMFKLTYQAFVLMSLLGGWVVGSKEWKRGKYLLRLMAGTIVAGLLLFPYFAYRDYYGRFKTFQGLDGLGWLRQESRDDYEAVIWLRENIEGRPVILEAVGESYTKFGRVAVFSGLPTVLGWRVHEWLWRGGFEIPGERTNEVKLIYEEAGSVAATEILSKYQVEYIFVGKQEAETYKLDRMGLKRLGKIVWQKGLTEVIAVNRDY